MVSQGMAITLIGLASGGATAVVNLALSKKIKGRLEISKGEVIMAMAAVAAGSAAGYFFIKRKEEVGEIIEEEIIEEPLITLLSETPMPQQQPVAII